MNKINEKDGSGLGQEGQRNGRRGRESRIQGRGVISGVNSVCESVSVAGFRSAAT